MSWTQALWIIIVTAIISGTGGLLIASLLVAAKNADEQMEKLYKEQKVNE